MQLGSAKRNTKQNNKHTSAWGGGEGGRGAKGAGEPPHPHFVRNPGLTPPCFKHFFLGWTPNFWDLSDPPYV